MSQSLKLEIRLDANGNAKAYIAGTSQALETLSDNAQKSSQKVSDSFSRIDNSIAGVRNQVLGLAGAYLSFNAVESIIKTADAYKSMQNQIKLVTETTNELYYVQQRVSDLSNATYSSMPANAKLLTAMQAPMKELGRTTDETIRFTETFNKALALTSPTYQESASTILQFVQAMGSGVLRGEEFNSLMENGRGVVQALADGLGVPIGALRKMAEEGKLTAEVVVQALESQRQAVDQKFGKMDMLVSQSWQIMTNEAMNFVGALDSVGNSSSGLASSIKSLATDLGTVTAFVNDWAVASKYADDSIKGASNSAGMFAGSISTGDLLRTISSELYDLGLAFSAVGSDISLVQKILTTEIDTSTVDNIKKHWADYNAEITNLETKSTAFKASMKQSTQVAIDQEKEVKKLKLTTAEYASQAGMLYAQEAGFGTQTEMLLEQEKAFGNTLLDVTRITQTYGKETETSSKFTEKGKDIIGKLQEQYALLGMSVRDAAVAKAVFDAQNKGATPEEIAYIKDMAGRVYDLSEAKKAATTTTKEYTKSLKDLKKEHLEYLKITQNENYDAFEKNLQDSEAYTKKQADALEALRDELNPTMALYKKYGEQVLLINQEANMSDTDRSDLIKRLNDKHQESLESLRIKSDDEYATMAKLAKNSLKRLDDAFANTWESIFVGSKDFGQS